MNWSHDARIPVSFGPADAAGADDAILIEGDALAPAGHAVARFAAKPQIHPIGCVCCLARPEAAVALGELFQARARGQVAFFKRVVAAVSDEAALKATLANDPVLSGRYRLA